MKHYNAKPIKLDLQPSYKLAAILAAAALLGCSVVVFMPLLIWVKLLLCLLTVLSACYYIAQDALLLLPWSWVNLTLNAKAELTAKRRNGLSSVVAVLPSSLVTSYLMVLNLRVQDSYWQRNLLLLSDSADSTAQRHLRIWLRWGPHAAEVGGAVSDDLL